ncbi:hypothetical protein ACFL08_02395 [Patescibacteria group bacterium]
MRWMKEQRIGFSVQSVGELERVVRLGANMAELKLEKFANHGEALYFFDGVRFTENEPILRRVTAIAKKNNVQIQFHLSVERCLNSRLDTGINVSFLSHHRIAIKRFCFLEKICRKYGIGRVITMHPPAISFKGLRFATNSLATTNSKIFFDRLDKIRLRCKHRTLIGVENMTSVKYKAGNLGYKTRHFKGMLRDTRTFGLTIDTGHRLLTGFGDDDRVFHIRELLGLGFPPVNFHFHGNEGKFNYIDWGDDQHEFPSKDNVKGFKNFLRYFRRNRTPVVLEISNLHKRTNQEIQEFLVEFRGMLV